MKKRVLSLFMAFVLCLTLLPTSAFAAGGTGTVRSGASGNVAKVGDTEYETLQGILDEMKPVEITLLGNVTEDLTVYAATTIDMNGYRITGDIEADESLTLDNGTVKGNVKVDGGTFTMAAPADAAAAIDGGLNVISGSCNISGAKIGVKGTLYFDGTDMTIKGTEKAVELTAAAGPASKAIYGAATVNGNTSEEATFAAGTYKVGGEIARKLSNTKAGGSTTPAATLTIAPETASAYNGQTVTFTGTYTGTGTLNAYVQGDAVNGYFTFDQVNNGDGTYTLSVAVDEQTPDGNYTLYVHEVGNAFVQAKATITVTAAVAKDDKGTYYTSIKDAIEKAPDGSTVTVIAAANQISLPDGIYVENKTGITLDLNGHSLDGYPLKVGGLTAMDKVRTGKLTVVDSAGGNGAVGVAVRDGGTLVFNPENNYTTLLQMQVYGGTVQLRGGKILRSGLNLENGVKLADLLPTGEGFAYYRADTGTQLTLEEAASKKYDLVVKSCDHGGASGFAVDADKCPDCGAPAVAYTQLNLPESSGNPWRRFADLQTALDADRNGGSVVRLLADVSGNYNIDGNTTTGLDLNGHSINGTVTVKAADGLKDTTFSNSNSTGTGSIQTVVAFKGARLANSGSPAVIGTLKLATDATWENILQQKTLGYKVQGDDGSYKWYAPSLVNATELNNVIIGTLPVPSASLSFKVNDKNITSGNVDRGTTVQLCAYCNTSGAGVTFKVGKREGSDIKFIELSGDKVEYKKIGSTWYYVAEYTFNEMGSYEIYFSATKDGYSVTSSTKTLTVTKASIPTSEITAPTAKTLTYTGLPQKLVTAGKLDAKYGTILYSLSRSASSFSTEIPTKIDAGTYKVYYKIVGNDNYKDINRTYTLTVTIDPMKIDHVMFVNNITKTYDGTAEFSLTNAERYNCLRFYGEASSLIDVDPGAYAIDGRVRFLAKNTEDEYVDSPEAGQKSYMQFTVKLHSKNYVLQASDGTAVSELTCIQSGGAKFTINKAKVTPADENVQLVFKDLAKTYEIDLSTFLPGLTPPCEYGDITYPEGVKELYFKDNAYHADTAVMSGSTLNLPIAAANSSKSGDEIGTVTVTITPANYEPFDLTIKIVAQDKLVPISTGVTVSATEITYGQMLSESKLTSTGKMTHPGTGEEIKGTFAWKDDTIKPDAGNYEAEWVFTPDASYGGIYAAATGKVTVTVNKAASSVITAPTAKELTYNGSAQELVTAGTATGGKMKYRLGDSGDFSTDIPTATNAGTYTVYYKLVGDSNHNDTAERSITVTISPLTLYGVKVDPISKSYDGTADVEITKSKVKFMDGTPEGIVLPDDAFEITNARFTVLQEDGESYTDSPEVGNGKSLSFHLKLTSNNYVLDDNETGEADCNSHTTDNYKITKADAPTNIQTGTLNIINGTTLTYTYDSGKLLPAAPKGEYGVVYYGGKPSSNFEPGYTVDSCQVGINSGVLTLKIDAQNGGKVGKIGSVLIYVTTDNYETFSLPVDLYAINQITPEPDGDITASEITYGDALSKSEISGKMKAPDTGKTVNGTFAWKNSTVKPNAGSYDAEWTFTPAEGYEEYATATGTVTVKVNKADPTFTAPTAKEVTYNGSAQELVTAGTATGGKMKYRLGDSGDFSTDIPKATDAGTYTVYYMVEGDSNHNDTAAKSVEVIIKAKTVSEPTIIVEDGPFIYTGKEIKPEVTVKDGDTVIPADQYTVSYKDNTNVGTATVTVTSNDGGNYSFTGSKTFTIIKADADFTAPTARELTYTGSAQALVTAGTTKHGAMKYRLGDSGDFSTDIPKAINAGTYTVYYMVEGDSNHKDTTAQSVTATITAKTVNPTITVNGGPFVYTGSEIKPTVTVKDGETVIPNSQYTVSYKDNTNVGTATVTVTSNDGGNYVFSDSTTFEITKADSTFTAPAANTLTYNGKEQALVAAGTTKDGKMKYRLGDSGDFTEAVPTAINAGTYTVYFMVEGDSNHKDTDAQSVEVTIATAKLADVSVRQDGTLTYNGKEQTAAVITAATPYGENEVVFTFSAEENGDYTDAVPAFINAGTYTVYYKAAADNHETASGSFTVTIDKAKLENVSVSQRNELTYNGGQQTVEVDATATTVDGSDVTFTYSMEKDGTYGDLPTFTNAGIYTVWYKAEAENHETFIGSFTVTVEKATVTVTALDKSAYVGDKAPDLSAPVKDTDYTVSDMFGDDQLAGTIKLAYVDDDGNEIVPDMTKPGEVIIRASGLTDPNENYTVVFVDGKLTISYRPSSGGSGHGDYVIKASAGTGGSISPSGNVSVRKGADQTFTIKPDKGYAVADVKVDGKSVGAVRSYTFKNIEQSHTIEVSFVKAIGAPDTGDGSNLPLWIALLFASACGLAGTTLYTRRKRVK